MPRRDARKTAADPADAAGGAAAVPAAAPEAGPQAAADAAADAAVRARDEAAARLEEAQARLGSVRGELAAAERDRERLADELAADPVPETERGYREACQLVETRGAIRRAHERRVDAARQDLDHLEAGLIEARRGIEMVRLGRAWDEVEDRADAIDAAVATLATGLPKLLEACVAYDRMARPLLGAARNGVVAERETLELSLKTQLMNLLPNAFRVFPREQSTLLTVLETVRRRRGAAYSTPPVTASGDAAPVRVADRSDPTGGSPDPGWLREQDRQTAEARRAAPEPLLR